MNKLIVPVALAMFSVSMASAALADQPGNPGQGFEQSLNPNACLNSGAGNGGENFELRGGPLWVSCRRSLYWVSMPNYT